MKQIHTYAGLLSFTAFVVWGATGLHAIFLPKPGEWTDPEVSEQREISFAAPGNLDDRELARRIFEVSEIDLSNGPGNIRRDENHQLTFSAYSVNGRWDVTYFEPEQRVLVQARQNDLWGFLSAMHAGHSRRNPPDFRLRMWGYYNEFSTWAFFFMAISGLYLWLVTRPRMRWAQMTAGASAAFFVILWILTR